MLFVAMVSSFTPTPLYPLYQREWGIGDGLIGVAFAAYPVAVMVTLVLLGGVSDRFGRRVTMICAQVLLIVALAVFSVALAYPLLLLGRILQGVAIAVAAGAGAAALMDAHPKGIAAGSYINTLALAMGAAMGPFLSGYLADTSTYPLIVPYIAVGLLAVIPILLLLRTSDVHPPLPEARLIKAIRLPRNLWPSFSIAAAAILGTNLAMGLFGSFGGEIAATVGLTSEFDIGLLVSVVLAGMALSQVAARTLRPQTSMTTGIFFATTGWALVTLASNTGSPWVMFIGAVGVGTGAGMCLLGSAALIGIIAPHGRRAEIYSSYLMVAFGAMAAMSLVAGSLLGAVGTTVIVGSAFAECCLLTGYILVAGRRFLPAQAQTKVRRP
jgi:MFS family permease